MTRSIAIAALVGVVLCTPALAGQSSNSNSNSASLSTSGAIGVNAGNSTSGSNSHSGSSSTATATGVIATGGNTLININGSSDPSSDPSGDPPADPSSSSNSSNVIRNTPDAVAPSLYGGTNPCAVGGSAAGSGPGIGLSFGFTTSSRDCVRRNWFTLLMQSAGASERGSPQQAMFVQWAINLACDNEDVRGAVPSNATECGHSPKVARVEPQNTNVATNPAPVQVAAADTISTYAVRTSTQVVGSTSVEARPIGRLGWCYTVDAHDIHTKAEADSINSQCRGMPGYLPVTR
jgi:hypothetical protein